MLHCMKLCIYIYTFFFFLIEENVIRDMRGVNELKHNKENKCFGPKINPNEF